MAVQSDRSEVVTVQNEQNLVGGRTLQPRVHLDFLDGLRALAAAYVILFHLSLIVWQQPDTHNAVKNVVKTVTAWMYYGRFAVALFIVLSGFCLMLPVVRGDGGLRGGVADYFKRRARRILPPYYCALLLSILLATTVISQPGLGEWDTNLPVTVSGVVAHVLLIQNLSVDTIYKINAPLWSVAVECQIYLLFPLMLVGWQKWGGKTITALALLLGTGGYGLLHGTRYAGLTPQYIGLFALGMFAAAVCYSDHADWQHLSQRVPWGAMAGVLLVFLTLACLRWGKTHTVGYEEILAGMAAACLLVALAQQADSRERQRLAKRFAEWLAWKPLVVVGTFSYSIYLLHMPLLQLVYQYGVHPLRLSETLEFCGMIGVGAPLILAAAYLFHIGCERPFMSAFPTGNNRAGKV